MSFYQGKLLELLAIKRGIDRSFLHIRLSFYEQNTEILWEIDQETAESIDRLALFKENYKYRLSLTSQESLSNQQYISFLTRTFRGNSEKAYFFCSEEYIQGLHAIKCLEHISKLHTLPFLSTNLPSTKLEREQSEDGYNGSKRQIPLFAPAMFCAILITLLSYLGHSIINETATASSQEAVDTQPFTGDNVRMNTMVTIASIQSEQNQDSTVDVSEPSPPTIEVTNLITYGLPKGNVALTFDDGPSKYSMEITDILEKYEVGGTFFFTGVNVKKYPEYVQYVQSKGYSIGNHSMNHVNFTQYSYEHQENELIYTNQLIEEIILEPVVLFRPPYGAMNEITIELVENANNKLVLWNRDTEDWKHHNPDEIINYIVNSNVSGTIILLHESQAVVEALPQIIEYLLAMELQIVSLK